MANGSSGDRPLVDKMRGTEINPIIPIVAAVIVIIIIGYFGWLRPKMAEDKILREFNSPEAQAKRDPDQRKVSPGLQAQIAEMRAKEQHLDAGDNRRKR